MAKESSVKTEEKPVETVVAEPVTEGPKVEMTEGLSAGGAVTVVDNAPSGLTVAPAQERSEFSEFEEDSGMGRENVSTEDMAIPFISILQKMSPQVDKTVPEFIKGAEPGDFFNNVTMRVWKQENGLIVLPVVYSRRYTEWRKRDDKGGGLVKDWKQDDSALKNTKRDEKGKDITPAGTVIVTSAVFYSFLLDPADWSYERCVLSMSSTQFRKGKNWNTTIGNRMIVNPITGKRFTPAMFFSAYRLDSLPESNDQGSWYGWGIKFFGDVKRFTNTPESTFIIPGGEDLYQEAKKFAKAIQDDLITVQHPSDEAQASETGASGPIKDGDVPF